MTWATTSDRSGSKAQQMMLRRSNLDLSRTFWTYAKSIRDKRRCPEWTLLGLRGVAELPRPRIRPNSQTARKRSCHIPTAGTHDIQGYLDPIFWQMMVGGRHHGSQKFCLLCLEVFVCRHLLEQERDRESPAYDLTWWAEEDHEVYFISRQSAQLRGACRTD